MHNTCIEIKNIKKYYSSKKTITKVLDDVSITISQGEILGLLGVNGAGKTTLSSIIATLHPPTEGDVLWQGQSIYKNLNEYRKTIGFCPQKPNLIQELTVKQNLLWAGRFFDIPEDLIQERVATLVKQYELKKYLDTKPEDLSGGYQQRVLIARSLIHDPKLIILDEPTVGLDPHIRHYLWENIRNLKNKGISIILTTHYLDEAEFLSDRICILDKGKIRLTDTPENLKTSYQQSKLEDIFITLLKEEPL